MDVDVETFDRKGSFMGALILKPISRGAWGLCLLLAIFTISSGLPGSRVWAFRKNLPSDRTVNPATSIHLIVGNPSNATMSVGNPANYLLLKQGYALSYNRDRGGPNWVSWQLNSSWFGRVRRSDNWSPDNKLPRDWGRVAPNSYKGSGYDRGHMTPSDDRTKSPEINSETFLMTNILPQAPDNNRGAWVELEKYCRELVRDGKELYIIAGGVGKRDAIAGGKVTVPARVWKVIVVLDRPGEGVGGVNNRTRTIAVDMPNENGISQDWQQFKTSIDKLEADTGYDFLSAVPDLIQSEIESRVDGELEISNGRNIIGIGIFALVAAIVAFGLYRFRHSLLKLFRSFK